MTAETDSILETASIKSTARVVVQSRHAVNDEVLVSSTAQSSVHWTIAESIGNVQDSAQVIVHANTKTKEQIYAASSARIVVRVKTLESVAVTTLARSGPVRSVVRESANVSGTATARVSSRSKVAETAKVSGRSNTSHTVSQVLEAISVTTSAVVRQRHSSVVVESVSVSSVANGLVRSRSTVVDSVQVSETALSRVHAVTRIKELASINGRVVEPLSGYAWTASTDTFAMSRYTGYRFNSAARIGNRMIAAAPGGLYVLSGTTDAGTDINASLATGLSDVGDPQQKRMREVFVGYESSGTLQFKVSGTGTGTEAGYTYALPARRANDQVAGRTKIGRGMRSRFWRFELFSKLGQPFKVYESRISIDSLSRKI